MENYKKKLKNELSSQVGIFCCCSVLFISGQSGFLSKFYPEGNFGDFFRGFHVGIFIVFAMFMIASVARIGMILKDDAKLKADYIKNTDERNLKISELTGYKLYNSIIAPILVATIMSGFFSMEVFFTLLSVSTFIAIVTWARWIYYSKKI